MTADIRTAAQREAERFYPKDMPKQMRTYSMLDFEYGAVWAASRVTPTREQLVDALDAVDVPWGGIDLYEGADAILALMAGLAEGEI